MTVPTTFGAIERPRILMQVRRELECPLLMLHAPLGYGKTIALAQALAQHGSPIAWYDAQPWHAEAFVEPLVEAIRTVRPDFGRRSLALAQDAAPLTRVGAQFAADLGHVDALMTIVLDDAHVLATGARFGEFLDAVVPALPPTVRLVISTRSSPGIAVGDHLVRRRLALIGPDDLRFDGDDVLALARLLRVEIDEPAASRLCDATEGWPAAIALNLQYGDRRVPTPAGSLGAVSAYLFEQIIARLPARLAVSLEELAPFDEIDVRLFDPARGMLDARATLEELERAGVPVRRIDDDRYRLHRLLREEVAARMRERDGGGAFARAHGKAAAVYEAAGRFDAALYHLLQAGDDAGLLRFLSAYAEVLAQGGGTAQLLNATQRLRRANGDDPALLFTEALIEKQRGGTRVRAAWEAARGAADRADDAQLAFAARAGLIEYRLTQLEPLSSEELTDLRARAKNTGEDQTLAAEIRIAWAAAIAGDFAGLLSGVERLPAPADPKLEVDLTVLRCYAMTVLGDFAGAERESDALIRSLEESDRVLLHIQALGWSARLALLRGQTMLAFDCAREAIRLRGDFDLRVESAALWSALAEAAVNVGDATAALAAAHEARRSADRAWYVADVRRMRATADLMTARALCVRGDVQSAQTVALSIARDAQTPAVQRAAAHADLCVYAWLTRSGVARQQAEASSALHGVEPVDGADAVALACAHDLLAFVRALEADVDEPNPGPALGVFARMVAGRRGAARLEIAGRALRDLAHGSDRARSVATALELLCAEGPRIEALLALACAPARLTERGDAFDALIAATERVRARFPADTPILAAYARRPADTAAHIGMTPREAEILRFLVDGFSNKEIAQRLVLSPRTVETHVERLLSKLEVPSRSRAIAKAIRVGVVVLDER